MLVTMPTSLPREAYGPRGAVRAGAVWRVLQGLALYGSEAVGWPPERYRSLGSAFVVREMTVVYERTPGFAQPLRGDTWIAGFRHGLLCRRELDLYDALGACLSASQDWAHLGQGRPARAPVELMEAFAPLPGRDGVRLPATGPELGEPTSWETVAWHSWMDPLGHANHPLFIDWCDEALATSLVAAGGDAQALRPVAEWVRFRRPVFANERVVVRSQRVACDAGLAHRHELEADGHVVGEAITVRALLDDASVAR